jgi:hypothetical protein
MRLAVDNKTRLPALPSWMWPGVVAIASISSTVAVTARGEVVESTPLSVPAIDADPGAPKMVERRMVPSNFQKIGEVNWPHRLTETTVDGNWQMDLGTIRLNPKIDSRRFATGSGVGS